MAFIRIVWSGRASGTGAPQLRLEGSDGDSPIDLGRLRLEAEWLGWEQSAVAVERIEQELPWMLQFHDYSFAGSLRKRLWGSCYRHSALVALASEQLSAAGHEVELDVPWRIPGGLVGNSAATTRPPGSRPPWRTAARVWWELANGGKTTSTPSVHGGIAFLAGDDRRFSYYEPLLKKLGSLPRTACFGIDAAVDGMADQEAQLTSMNVRAVQVRPSVPCSDIPREAFAISRILRQAKSLTAMIGLEEARVALRFLLERRVFAWKLESLFRQVTPRVLLVNAYEVAPPADLLVQIAHSHGCAVVNSMNGTKTPSPGNGGVVFDTWFVHSEIQRSTLVDQCGVESSQLQVVGHPRADAIAAHRYQGSGRELFENWDGLTIIAAFSQPAVLPGDYRERFFAAIQELVHEREDVAIAIKLHPRERASTIPTAFSETDRLRIVPPTVELYDLLDRCDAVAVMYSTVAIEALQMGKPVVALNQTGADGILPGTGWSDWFRETTTTEEFMAALDQLPTDHTQVRELEAITGPLDGLVIDRMAYGVVATMQGGENQA